MMSDDEQYSEKLVLNSFVCLPGRDNKYKCSCCNVIFSNIEGHLNSISHKNRIAKYVLSESHFVFGSLKDYFKTIFCECIAISLPSLLNNDVRSYHSYCYKCLKVLKDGTNGIKQHSNNGHRTLPGGNSTCHDCLINLSNIKNHIDISEFHNLITKDLRSYGIELSEVFNNASPIKNVPCIWKDMQQYRSIFLTLVVHEMKSQRAAARNCRIDNLHVTWTLEKTSIKPAVGSFKILPYDDSYFKIKLGDELVVYLDQEGWSMRSIVTKVPYDYENDRLCVTLVNNTGLKPEIQESYSITPKFTTTVFWRFRCALNQALSCSNHFRQTLLNQEQDQADYNDSPDEEDHNDSQKNITDTIMHEINLKTKINDSQAEAIILALSKNFFILHGPFGTGKTTTCALIIFGLRIKYKTKKILVCAPSNKAVDVLAQKLHSYDIKIVRVFSKHAEYLDSAVKNLSLTNLALEKDPELKNDYDKYINNTLLPEKYAYYKKRFDSAKHEVLSESMVTCTTLLTAGSEQFENISYDFLLVDEAAQALEVENLVPVTSFNITKVILVGDHKQLPPLVISKEARNAGFDVSMFQRLKENTNIPSVMLNTQYRMNSLIALFSNVQFYNNGLVNGVRDDDRTISLQWFKPNDKAMIFINTKGTESQVGTSYFNQREGEKIVELVSYLINGNKISPQDIAIITFYDGQNFFLHKLVCESPTLKTTELQIANVDAYQGNEKNIIILSLVRSNYDGNIGFSPDEKRLNVALTRAKFRLFIFGNRKTFQIDPLYKRLFKHIDENCASYEDDFISKKCQLENSRE